MKRVKSTIMRNYFLSYMLIFSIPFAVLGIVIYYNAVVAFKGEIEASNLNKLEQIRVLADRQMQELRYVANSISTDPKLTPHMVQFLSYSRLEAIEELRRYRNGNVMMDEILIYYHGDSNIYSSQGQTDIQTFAEQFVSIGGEPVDSENVQHRLIRPAETTIRPVMIFRQADQEPTRIITYQFPIPYMKNDPYGTGLVFIRESRFTSLIENTLGAFQGGVFILNEQGHMLISKNNERNIDPEAFLPYISPSSEQTGIYNAIIDHEPFSVASVRSPDTGWTFVMVMPTSQFLHRVIQIKTIIYFVLASVGITGLLIAMLLSANHSLPIRRLAEFIKRSKDYGVHPKINELELIQYTINSQFERNEELQQRLEAQGPYVQEQIIIRLLKGNFQHMKELEELLACQEIQLSGSRFFVLLIALDESEDEFQLDMGKREELREILTRVSQSGWTGYGVELIYEDVLAVLVNITEDEGNPRQKQALIGEFLRERVKETIQWVPTISIGCIYHDIGQINRSFIESMAAMEYRMKNNKKELLFFDEIHCLAEQSVWYSIEDQIKLVHGLKQGDQEVAGEALNRMLADILDREQSILLLKCSCFEVINTFFKTLKEMNISEYFSKMKGLLEFKSVQHLESLLMPLIVEVCQEVARSKEGMQDELKEQILSHIHTRFKSSQLTLEEIAQQHKLSLSYVSRFIKQHTGSTFTEYMYQLRLAAIKQELVETDKNIKDIITEHGYTGVSTFIDKFRRSEGITPGEFRRIHSRHKQ